MSNKLDETSHIVVKFTCLQVKDACHRCSAASLPGGESEVSVRKREVESPAKYRFEDRMLFIGLPFFVLAGVSIFLQQHFGKDLTGLMAAMCVLLASSPYIGFIVLFFLYFREERDEFQARMLSGAMLCALGATMFVTSLWGVSEQFHVLPIFHVGWVMPMSGIFYSIALAVQRWRYR